MSRVEKTTEQVPSAEPAAETSFLSRLEVPPMIRKALQRHRRDLPELIRSHGNQWVAYRGEERLEFGKSKRALYHKYLDRGLSLDELVVLSIEPEPPDELDLDEWARV